MIDREHFVGDDCIPAHEAINYKKMLVVAQVEMGRQDFVIHQLKTMLKQAQWVAVDIMGEGYCFVCRANPTELVDAAPGAGYQYEPAGVHEPGCELARLIK